MAGLLDFLGGPTDLSNFDPSKLGLLQFLQQQATAPAQPDPNTPPQAKAAAPMGLLSSLMGQVPLSPIPPDDSEADTPAAGAQPASLSAPPMSISAPPGLAPMSLAGATTAPAPATQPAAPAAAAPAASGGGFLDKIGNIYGAGGGGDGLINLGLALMSPGDRSANLMRAAAMNQQGQQTALANQQKQLAMQGSMSVLQKAYPNATPAELLAIAQNPANVTAAFNKANPNPTIRQETDASGNIWNVDTTTGQRTVALKTDKDTQPKLTTVADPNTPGMVVDKWIKPGEADGPVVGTPYSPSMMKGTVAGRVVRPGEVYVGPDGKELYKGPAVAGPSEDLVGSLATRAIQGDSSWKTGLARVPGLITAVEEEVAKRGKAEPTGNNADTIMQNRANQAGRVKEQGTLGTATANNTLYGNTAASAMDTAINASKEVDRTSWVPVNKIVQMGQTAMSNPKLAAFVAANNTLVNEYAKATTPAGVPTDSQRQHAEEMLNTAKSQDAYEAVVKMMHQEVGNTHRAIEITKQQLRSGHSGALPPLQSLPGGQGPLPSWRIVE